MGKNKIGLQFSGLEQMISGLEKANSDVKGAVENALKASKRHVNKALERDTVNSNFPAKGEYSKGDLAKSINKDYAVQWNGLTAEVKVGYDFRISGLVSIFMIYGTPRHMKVQKIYNDFYGSRIKKELSEIQQETLNKILERAVNNGR